MPSVAARSTPTILHDIPICLTPEEVVRAQYGDLRERLRPGLVLAAQEAITMSRALITPAAVYCEWWVHGLAGQQVFLSADATPMGEVRSLALGPKADLLAPASRAIVAVYTIGQALENRVHELHAAREDLLAFMLDSVGVMALGIIGEAIRDRVEQRASELGWGVSPALSPGSLVGWPVQGQREVCALLPLDEISVRLNDYCVLEPHKSVSMVIGLGPGYSSAHVGSVCCYCCLADHCWRRRE